MASENAVTFHHGGSEMKRLCCDICDILLNVPTEVLYVPDRGELRFEIKVAEERHQRKPELCKRCFFDEVVRAMNNEKSHLTVNRSTHQEENQR